MAHSRALAKRKIAIFALISPVLALGIAGCGLTSEDCVSLSSAAIVVHVTDAVTGQPLTSGLTLITRGPSNDSVTTTIVGDAFQLSDRPGTYSLVVRKAGYRDYTQDGIRVPDSGSCNRPVTQFISVSLQPG